MAKRDDQYHAALTLLGGERVNPASFAPTVQGLDEYLKAVGVRYFSGAEMTKPHQPDKAARCGFSVFLPDQAYWHYGAVLALIADRCRRAAGGPVHCRNWWRPVAYNRLVSKGNPMGDHPNHCAVDLDYSDEAACQRAIAKLERLDDSGLLRMSLGLGRRTTHVGCFSPLGPRHWSY